MCFHPGIAAKAHANGSLHALAGYQRLIHQGLDARNTRVIGIAIQNAGDSISFLRDIVHDRSPYNRRQPTPVGNAATSCRLQIQLYNL
jgi:hypothetical protein